MPNRVNIPWWNRPITWWVGGFLLLCMVIGAFKGPDDAPASPAIQAAVNQPAPPPQQVPPQAQQEPALIEPQIIIYIEHTCNH